MPRQPGRVHPAHALVSDTGRKLNAVSCILGSMVEDDPVLTRVLRDNLTFEGFDVASVAQAAIAYVQPGSIVGVGTGSTVNHFIEAPTYFVPLGAESIFVLTPRRTTRSTSVALSSVTVQRAWGSGADIASAGISPRCSRSQSRNSGSPEFGRVNEWPKSDISDFG